MKKLVVLVLVLGLCGSASAFMLTNGGFNDPTGAFSWEPAMPGWTMTDNGTNMWYTEVPSSTHASGCTEPPKLLCTWVNNGSQLDGVQDTAYTLKANRTYTFSMDVCNWTGGTSVGYLNLGTKSSGAVYTAHATVALNDTTVVEGSGTGTVPNQDWHTKTISISTHDGGLSGSLGDTLYVNFGASNLAGGNFEFDNGILTPEPATIALLGMGGLALIRRKR